MERKKLLIADDSEMNRAILANILDQDYEIIEAADGREAIAALQVYHGEISALLLDIIMPEMDGFAVLEEMRAHGWLEEVPVIRSRPKPAPPPLTTPLRWGPRITSAVPSPPASSAGASSIPSC